MQTRPEREGHQQADQSGYADARCDSFGGHAAPLEDEASGDYQRSDEQVRHAQSVEEKKRFGMGVQVYNH